MRRTVAAIKPVSTIGEVRYITAGGQRIRVNVREGTGVPLVLCNGIGASLEVLDPLVEQLRHFTAVIAGREPPLISVEDAMGTLAVVAAVHDAARTGACVSPAHIMEQAA